jgi:cyanate permease
MIGAGICLGLVFTTANLTLDALFLAGGFFCLELVIGPIWSIPMDIAPQYAGTGSGLMNTGSAVAAIVSPLAFGLIVDLTGSWVLPFAVSIALLLLGCAMAFTMHPERRFAEAMPGTATIGAG